MTSIIKADNGAVSGITGITQTADNTGTLELQATSGLVTMANVTGALTVPTGTTAQRPASPVAGQTRYNTTTSQTEIYSGTAWTAVTSQTSTAGPAFSAYLSTDLNVTSGTITKVPCNVEEFDTNSCYDNATNYRFTPNVAGYYQVTVQCYYNTNASSPSSFFNLIYKNGVSVKTNFLYATTSVLLGQAPLTALIYMNGSTDYLEFYARSSGGTSTFFSNGSTNTFFQAHLARAA